MARNSEGRIVRIKATADLLRWARAGTIGCAQNRSKAGLGLSRSSPRPASYVSVLDWTWCENAPTSLRFRRFLKPGREIVSLDDGQQGAALQSPGGESHCSIAQSCLGAATGKSHGTPGHSTAAFERRSEPTRTLIFEADRFTREVANCQNREAKAAAPGSAVSLHIASVGRPSIVRNNRPVTLAPENHWLSA
jgi:hypothetical protein